MNDRPDTNESRPGVMPWPAIALLVAIVAAILLPSFLIFSQDAPAAIPGLIAGVFGAVLSPRRGLPWPLITGAVCVLAIAGMPTREAAIGAAAVLCLVAGTEASTTGGRSGVMALFLLVALWLIPSMPDTGRAVLPALCALGAGWAVVRLTPLAGSAVQAPATLRFGLGLAGFLMAGLIIAVYAMHHIDDRFAHWLALLFIMRGLAAPGQVVPGALRFGAGAMAGSLLALLILTLDLPALVLLGLAALAFLAGLRVLPHPGPYSPAAFSVSVLLAIAPSQHAAMFRLEAVAFAVLLSVVLATVFAVAWSAVERLLDRRGAADQPKP